MPKRCQASKASGRNWMPGESIALMPMVPLVRLKPPRSSPFWKKRGMISPNPSVTIAR